MIMVASSVAIAQENVLVARQGQMVRKRSSLCFLDGRDKVVIPETELKQLLDEETYDSYRVGKRFFKIGTGLACSGFVAAVLGYSVGARGVEYMRTSDGDHWADDDQFNKGGRLLTLGVALGFYGIMMIPGGFVFRGVGAKRINGIADDYNQKNRNTAISYRLLPSVMPLNVPQSQCNMALGMTLGVNF